MKKAILNTLKAAAVRLAHELARVIEKALKPA